MARVLYGIHGTGHGHAMRGLTIARRLSGHEFLFVADDDAPKILEPEFPVRRLPNLGTVFRNYQVDVGATVRKAIPLLWHRQRYVDEVLRLIDQFKPDVCMTDLEYFVPRAAEEAGLPCLVGKVNMDRNAPDSLREDTDASLADTEELICRSASRSEATATFLALLELCRGGRVHLEGEMDNPVIEKIPDQ